MRCPSCSLTGNMYAEVAVAGWMRRRFFQSTSSSLVRHLDEASSPYTCDPTCTIIDPLPMNSCLCCAALCSNAARHGQPGRAMAHKAFWTLEHVRASMPGISSPRIERAHLLAACERRRTQTSRPHLYLLTSPIVNCCRLRLPPLAHLIIVNGEETCRSTTASSSVLRCSAFASFELADVALGNFCSVAGML